MRILYAKDWQLCCPQDHFGYLGSSEQSPRLCFCEWKFRTKICICFKPNDLQLRITKRCIPLAEIKLLMCGLSAALKQTQSQSPIVEDARENPKLHTLARI